MLKKLILKFFFSEKQKLLTRDHVLFFDMHLLHVVEHGSTPPPPGANPLRKMDGRNAHLRWPMAAPLMADGRFTYIYIIFKNNHIYMHTFH